MRLRDLFRIATRRDHVVDPTALRRLLERHLPYRLLEQAAIPTHVVATDMVLGVELCPVDSSPYDYSASASLISRARETTREWIRAGGVERPQGVPHEMAEHDHARHHL